MNSQKNIENILKGETISGKFLFRADAEILMDRDFENQSFIDLSIMGGDFCSSSFNNCIFKNVIIKNCPLVGVNFKKCTFSNCKFVNVQPSFSMNDCTIENLSITNEA